MEKSGLTIERLNPQDIMITDEDIHMYLLLGSERAMLVDTGFGVRDVPAAVRSMTELPLIVVNTHGHFDHAAGNKQFNKVYAHPAEHELIMATAKGDYELLPLSEGEKIDLGGRVFEVYNIPGHRPGSLALLERNERLIITGDNVVTTPIVMYLEGADAGELLLSLKKLESMRDAFDKIYPSHGEVPLGADMIDNMRSCIEEYLKGNIKGEPAVGPDGTPCIACAFSGAALYCGE
jgi:hydroxyacylglutathione hydrolase